LSRIIRLPDSRQIPRNKTSKETLNFFHTQSWPNPARFGQRCARFRLMPQSQVNERHDDTRSV
jgi:hypothetical protein